MATVIPRLVLDMVMSHVVHILQILKIIRRLNQKSHSIDQQYKKSIDEIRPKLVGFQIKLQF